MNIKDNKNLILIKKSLCSDFLQTVDKPLDFFRGFLINNFLFKFTVFFNIFIKLYIIDDNVSGFFPTLSFFMAIFFIFWAAQISHV